MPLLPRGARLRRAVRPFGAGLILWTGVLTLALPGIRGPVAAQPAAAGGALVFTHVTLIDATGAGPKLDMTLVVAGSRIAALGRTGHVRVPAGARVIDASGKFMIPGLWDMHAHWNNTDYLPLYLANGVTGIRLMKGLPIHQEWRAAQREGRLLVPRLVIASPLVDGPQPVFRDSIRAGTAAEGRAAVDKAIAGGADFIKVYSLLPRAAYFGVIDQARKRRVPVAGHVPRSITSGEASDAGQKSIEHLSGIAFACSRLQAELPQDVAKLESDTAAGANYLTSLRRLEGKHLDGYDPRRCAALFAKFRRNGTWQVPTLSVNADGVRSGQPDYTDPRQRYLPAAARSTRAADHPVYKHFTAADFARLQQNRVEEMRIVGAMQRAGVGILAGTDVALIGFSLHDELALFVESGLTPMQALQTATRNPAIYLGCFADLGTVETGKLADLVLLDADPLRDIRNTARIWMVVTDGRLLDRLELDRMLTQVAATADRR